MERKFEYGETDFPFNIETSGGTIIGGAETVENAIFGARTMIEEGDGRGYDVWSREEKRSVASVEVTPWDDDVEVIWHPADKVEPEAGWLVAGRPVL